MFIGHMHVSQASLGFDLQCVARVAASVAPERIDEDVCSDQSTDCPGLARAFGVAREGGTLIAWQLDRIGRSLPPVVGLVGELTARRRHDARRPAGVWHLRRLAECAPDLIHKRTMAGLVAELAGGRGQLCCSASSPARTSAK